MSAVVADTHVAVWYLIAPERLSSDATTVLDNAQADGDPICVTSISIVEAAYWVEKGRLPQAAYDRLVAELSRPDSGMIIVPLDLPIAQELRRIPRAIVPEMPDRIIAATAAYLNLPLVTRDLSIQAAGLKTIW